MIVMVTQDNTTKKVNKVERNTTDGIVVLIDLSGDTVTPETLPEGVTSHNAAGAPITGKLKITHVYTGTSAPTATLGVDGDIYLQK